MLRCGLRGVSGDAQRETCWKPLRRASLNVRPCLDGFWKLESVF